MANTRADNPRIRELEEQIRKLINELYTLAAPTQDELEVREASYLYNQDDAVDLVTDVESTTGKLSIIYDVLDQRDYEEAEIASPARCATCDIVLQGPGKSLGCEECNTAYCSDGCLNQHMVISGHGDSGQPDPEEVSDAS